jgi:hypothetical protein
MTATFTCPQCKGAGDVGWNGRVERCDHCDGKGILGSETELAKTRYRFEIEPRPSALGPAWRLRLLEQARGYDEVEVGGGVFPFVANDQDSEREAYAEALQVAEEWLQSRAGN